MLENKTYPQLKKMAKEMGLDTRGTKVELIERIQAQLVNELSETPEIVTAPEIVETEMKSFGVNKYDMAGREVESNCNEIFAGRAKAKFDGQYGIEFSSPNMGTVFYNFDGNNGNYIIKRAQTYAMSRHIRNSARVTL